jgi:predicted nucleotidyltransferase component of viral defense system
LIPASYIQEWSTKAPWPTSQLVEQDLIISRALCDLFNVPALAGKIAFRGGAAIHKLLFKQPLRYSEDIDLVQTQTEQIGATASAIRELCRGSATARVSERAIRCTSSSGLRPRPNRIPR